MSPKIKGILRIFLPALAVGILLSLLFLALMNGPLAQPAANPAAAPTATPAAEATPYDPSVTPEPTQPPDSLFDLKGGKLHQCPDKLAPTVRKTAAGLHGYGGQGSQVLLSRTGFAAVQSQLRRKGEGIRIMGKLHRRKYLPQSISCSGDVSQIQKVFRCCQPSEFICDRHDITPFCLSAPAKF